MRPFGYEAMKNGIERLTTTRSPWGTASANSNDRSSMKPLIYRSIPFAIGALFLILIALGVYRKSVMAVAPPIYDPIAYYHKSKVVWDALSKANFAGILNGVKANRPPGTALLLYPL